MLHHFGGFTLFPKDFSSRMSCRQWIIVLIVAVLSSENSRWGSVAMSISPVDDLIDQCQIADIVFVLDSSGSIGEVNWAVELDFIKSLVQSLFMGPDHIQIGIVTYGNLATVQFHLNQYQSEGEILAAIDEIPWKNQNTNTSGGLRVMRQTMFSVEHGDRELVPNVAIVITDGDSTRDVNLTSVEARLAREAGISIFALGIGSEIRDEELYSIASSPSQDFAFHIENFDMLAMIQNMLIEQTCRRILECAEHNDIVFILDSSGSVGEVNFELMRGFVEKLFNESIAISSTLVRVGLVTFSTTTQIHVHLGEQMESSGMLEVLREVVYTPGTTNTAEALRVAREEMFTAERGERPDRRNLIVLLTDGGSNEYEATVQEALTAKLGGIEILVVAITEWINMAELRAIASDPDDKNIFLVERFDEIEGIAEDLQVAMCAEPNKCSLEPCMNGGTCVAEINRYRCLCPEDFAGKDCQYACSGKADVVLLLDSSSSISTENWFKVVTFAKSLAEHVNGGEAGSRVAMVTFSTKATVQFYLNQYSSRREFSEACDVPYKAGSTNTAEAVRMMQEDVFTEENGDRDDVRNLAILVTDGRSNDKMALLEQSVAARVNGTTLMVIGVNVGGEFGQRELRSVASDPVDKMLINVADFDDLLNITYNNVLPTFVEAVCNNVDECSGADCGVGGTCVDGLFSYECQCPIGSTGRYCERGCHGEADIVFAVDVSGSIRDSRFRLIKSFLQTLVDNLEVRPGKTRVGLLAFSDSAYVHFHLQQYEHKQDVIKAIDNLNYDRGFTNIAAALGKMRVMFSEENGDRLTVPNFGILITDGEATVFRSLTLMEAVQARIDGIHMMVVAPESDFRRLEHIGIASPPEEKNIFTFESFNDLPLIVEPIISGMCDDEDECVSSPCQNDNQCVNGLQQYICVCRDEFTGLNCERRCSRRQDVVFVIDSSGSTVEMYNLVIKFTKLVVAGLNFAGGRTRVGVLTYGDEPQIRFNLNTYSTREEVINGIAFLKMAGRTNTADAIKVVADDMFASVYGDRTGDRNIMIVISDGFSTLNLDRTVDEARNAQNRGIQIISVGIGSRTNMAEIEAIASDPSNQNSFSFSDTASMDSSANEVLDSLCV